MAKNDKDRELTKKELEKVTGGKAAQQDPHKGVRSPFGTPGPGPAVPIDPDPVPGRDPLQARNRSKK